MVTPPPADQARAHSSPRATKVGIVAAIAAALFAGQIAKAQEEIWIGPPNSSWSIGSNWLDGTAPAFGGSPTLALRFQSSGTSLNDLGVFALNRITFDTISTDPATVSRSSSLWELNFTGVDPRVQLEGIGDAIISPRIRQLGIGDGITVSGSGPGSLVLTEIVTPNTLTIDTGVTSSNRSEVRMTWPTTISGGVILKSGYLAIAHKDALGNQPLHAYGGFISTVDPYPIVPNPIVLHGNVALRNGTFGGAISSAVPEAGLTIQSYVTLTAASTYTGVTTLDRTNVIFSTAYSPSQPTLNLDGENGSLLNTSQFNVLPGGILRLIARSQNDNRVADTTPIHLRLGTLLYREGDEGALTRIETAGPVDGTGFSAINVDLKSVSKAGLQLHLASLTRNERGTFHVKSESLGRTPGVGVGNIFVDAPLPGLVGGGGSGPKTSIVPYIIAGDDAGLFFGFVTYDPAVGVRVLDNTADYQPSLASAAPDENVRLHGITETLADSRVVNALYLDEAVIDGLGTLTIASGALVSRSRVFDSLSRISSPLAFGSTEAQFFVRTPLILEGPLSGTNGLTLSGGGVLTLAGPSTITGPLTVNSGSIQVTGPTAFTGPIVLSGGSILFSDANQFGPDSSTIVFNGGGALRYNGSGPLNFSRPIEIRKGYAIIQPSSVDMFAITTPITGSGELRLGGRMIRLPSGSTYTGSTYVNFGLVEIVDDSSFGAGGALNIRGGATIRLADHWHSAREINVPNGVIDTHGYNAVWNGPISSIGGSGEEGRLTKTGLGELRLTAHSAFRGDVVVDAGELTLADGSRLAADITVNGGAYFTILHINSDGRNKIGESSSVSLKGGTMTLIGNETMDISETIEHLILPAHGRSDQRLYLESPASPRVRLLVGDGIGSGGSLFIGASELGERQRVILSNPSALGGKIIPDVYAGAVISSTAESLVIYDIGTDSGGVIGIRPLRPGDTVPVRFRRMVPSCSIFCRIPPMGEPLPPTRTSWSTERLSPSAQRIRSTA